MHLGRVNSSHSLISFLCLLIFIDPLVPVNLNVLVFLFALGQSGPETDALILLLQNEQQMKTSLIPLGLLRYNFLEKLEIEAVVLAVTFTLELDSIVFQFDLLVADVSELDLDEYGVLPLSPLDYWMSKLKGKYSMVII